jgi:hypothetical protein
MGRTACTEPQCLYKGAHHFYLHFYAVLLLFCVVIKIELIQLLVLRYHPDFTDYMFWLQGCFKSEIVKCLRLFREVGKLQKASLILVMSVCFSVRSHGTTRLPLDGF